MTQDELGLSGRSNPDVAEAENAPIDEIRRELDRRGVNYRTPPGFKARIDAFRQSVAEDRKRITDTCSVSLTDEDRREIAEIERMPIDEIKRQLDERGVSHRAGAIAVRSLVGPRTIRLRLGWRDCSWAQKWPVPKKGWLAVAELAAVLALFLAYCYLWTDRDSSFVNASQGDGGPAYATTIGAAHQCDRTAPQTTPVQPPASTQRNN